MKVNFPHREDLPECTEGTVQTRSEVTGIVQHATLQEAVDLANKDKSIWKISYLVNGDPCRFIIR